MSRTKPKPKTKTIPWDSAAYLKSDDDIAHYLEAVFGDGDPALVADLKWLPRSSSDNGRRLSPRSIFSRTWTR